MKRFVIIFVLMIALLLPSCTEKTSATPIVNPASYLNGWYVDDGVVYIVCKLMIESTNNMTAYIDAYSEEDVGGLLENDKLTGYNEDMSSTAFELHIGMNEFVVVFVGVYGKSQNKADYSLPDEIIIREVDSTMS